MILNLKNVPSVSRKNINSEIKNFFVYKNGLFCNNSQTITSITKREQNKNGYLYEIILFGLNFHAKRLKYSRRDFYVDLQKSHRILLDENIETPFRTRIFKRRIVLFGYDKRSLINLINLIKEKKPQNSYFGHGAISNFDKFKVKPGKVKQK